MPLIEDGGPLIARSVARQTGTPICVEDTTRPGAKHTAPDDTNTFAVYCEEHGGFTFADKRNSAFTVARTPLDFCKDCTERTPAEKKESARAAMDPEAMNAARQARQREQDAANLTKYREELESIPERLVAAQANYDKLLSEAVKAQDTKKWNAADRAQATVLGFSGRKKALEAKINTLAAAA